MDDDGIGGCHKAISLEEALRRCRPMSVPETVASVNETGENEVDDSESIRWKLTPAGIANMQKGDEAIAHFFYLAGRCAETIDMPSLGTNIIPKEQAIQYGLEVLAYRP